MRVYQLQRHPYYNKGFVNRANHARALYTTTYSGELMWTWPDTTKAVFGTTMIVIIPME